MNEDASKVEPFRSNSSTCNYKKERLLQTILTLVIAALRRVIISQLTSSHTVTLTYYCQFATYFIPYRVQFIVNCFGFLLFTCKNNQSLHLLAKIQIYKKERSGVTILCQQSWRNTVDTNKFPICFFHEINDRNNILQYCMLGNLVLYENEE